ncbi:hypothetical protein [Dietzia cinnamea]|uniref:hypothetical protein n=1 Tax=Dietzia cinnamea TaxID=321318 RepID=UPI0021A8F6E9|nr:hypothetical protein [Dietzia cinnamea]MCT1713230.1 hypothetical protein [Dietzia cinnamea]MCT2273070.1 hypothetical protein [Dietzia cinnamea]
MSPRNVLDPSAPALTCPGGRAAEAGDVVAISDHPSATLPTLVVRTPVNAQRRAGTRG